MEIWINDTIILNRILNAIDNLTDEAKTEYDKSNFSQLVKKVCDKEQLLTQNIVIEFCLLTNINYKYIVLGEYPIYDVDDKNHLYNELIQKRDYTI